MRRIAVVAYCITSLLVWLAYGPYIHSHTREDGGELHAHLDLETSAHGDDRHDDHDDHADLPAFDHGDRAHRGLETSMFCGHLTPSIVPLAEIGEHFDVLEPPVLAGCVLEQPVRVHDPPARISANPRAPPA